MQKSHSYRDFFEIDTFDPIISGSVSITLSYLIKFKRAEIDAAPENQIVNFRFQGGRLGIGEIEVRSTEFSYPSGIFDLIFSEKITLQDEVTSRNPPSQSIIFRLYTFFPFIARDAMFSGALATAAITLLMPLGFMVGSIISGLPKDELKASFLDIAEV